ncbi:MAG: hypothetical protein IKF72_10035 [Kiritimatiellae bacterium]|nr:hypothetical protein [Kiritimatiellia bacterium]
MNKNSIKKHNREGSAKCLMLGFIAGISLCLFLSHCSGCKHIQSVVETAVNAVRDAIVPPPPPPPPRDVPCKAIVDDIRAIWSFERSYAYRHKALAASISEMGDGTGIGKNGFVLKPSIWASRIDGENASYKPVSYEVKNPATGDSEIAGYRFGVFPIKLETGERDRFSVVIVAVPDKPAEDDVCFMALCGPVNLQNDFTFDKEWPVFQLKAKPSVVESIRNLQVTTHKELMQRLTSGDLKSSVTKTFANLYYPQDEGQH